MGGGYLDGFLRKRVLPIYALMFMLILFYFGLKSTLSFDEITTAELFQSFIFGKTVISFGWYLQCIILLYLLFWCSATIADKMQDDDLLLVCIFMLVSIALYIGLCLLMELDSTWYETTLSFEAGMIICLYKPRIDLFLNTYRQTITIFVSFVLCFCLCFVFGCGPFFPKFISIPIKMCSSVFFCLCLLCIIRLINIKNPVTKFFSHLYLEIYIIQGAVYLMLRNRYWSLDSQIVFFIVAVALVILIAYLIKPLTTSFMCAVTNITKKYER